MFEKVVSSMGMGEKWDEEICEAISETRCYAISGPSRTLDRLEHLLARIEQAGEEATVRWELTLVDGRKNKIRFRVLASWIEET